jgi:uncharacterized protein (UPF0332 family)
MTATNREENARAEMRRAEEALVEAEALLERGLGNGAASRAYYGAFHAASALLARLGEQPRTHRGVHSLLDKRFVEPGLLAREHLVRLSRLEERRSVADYRAGEDVSAEQAASVVAEARVFVAAARALLDTLPP